MTTSPQKPAAPIPWFVPGDLDGFFALFIDNLLILMMIANFCPLFCGLPETLVFTRILPGAALSLLVGNVFYGWQARKLALATGRNDVTALPYGINTISVIAFCFYIMGPVWHQTQNADLTWKVGLFACFLTGIIEVIGAFTADWLRNNTPRAALLAPLAGLALTFLAGNFAFRIFSQPLIGVVPMLLILIAYGASLKLPWRVPAGLVAVLVGVLISGIYYEMGWPLEDTSNVNVHLGLTLPVPVDLFSFIVYGEGWKYFTVILPIGLLGVLSAIQILDSAEAAGDRYPTRSSLLMNGIGTLCAATFGSAFTTALYIGHPAWKVLGARSAYSTMNGVVMMLLCLFGGMTLVAKYVPMVATLGIILWIGVFMVVQAFQAIPKHHIPAVALGLIPALAGWVLVEIQNALGATDLYDVAPGLEKSLYLSGIIALSQGSLISAMTLSSILVYILDRKFLTAAGWAMASAGLAFFGFIHAGKIMPNHMGVVGVIGWDAAPAFALAYVICAGALVLCHYGRAAGLIKVGESVDHV